MNPETPASPKPDLTKPAPPEFLDLAKKPHLEDPAKTKTLTDLLQHTWLGLLASGGSHKDPIPMITFPQPPGFTPEDSHKVLASWGVIPESAVGKPDEIQKHFVNFMNDLAKNNRAAVVENIDEALPQVLEAVRTGPLAIVSKDHKQTVAMWPIGKDMVFMLKTTGDPQKDQFPFYIAVKPELLGLPPTEKPVTADSKSGETAPNAEESGLIRLLRKIFNLRLLLDRIKIFIEEHNPFRRKPKQEVSESHPHADIHPTPNNDTSPFVARQKGESLNGSPANSIETANPHQPTPAGVDSLHTRQPEIPPPTPRSDTNGNHNAPVETTAANSQSVQPAKESEEVPLREAPTEPAEETSAPRRAPRREYNRPAENPYQSGEAYRTNSTPRRTDSNSRAVPRTNGSRSTPHTSTAPTETQPAAP